MVVSGPRISSRSEGGRVKIHEEMAADMGFSFFSFGGLFDLAISVLASSPMFGS